MQKRLLSIGECMVELSQAGDGLLRKGFAGDSFNTAWYARACLSAEWSVDYLTALGDEPMSDEMAAFIERAGIGTGHIRRIAGRTAGLYMISLKDGERSFSYWRDSSAAKLLAADRDHLRAAIDHADVMYFSGITLAILSQEDAEALLADMRDARDAGKLVVFDPNIRPRLWQDHEQMLRTITRGAGVSSLVMPSYDDERAHFKDASIADTIARYRAAGAFDVVVKNAADGITLAFGDAILPIPATRVDRVVDTTSAGDSFNGAFLAYYLLDGDVEKAARYAADVAACVIGANGALVELPANLVQS
jgi:2-dehydro-3-deoxygluconokinase